MAFFIFCRPEQPGRIEAVPDRLQQGPDRQAREGVPQGELHLKVHFLYLILKLFAILFFYVVSLVAVHCSS
jgi:hypothetical protein